MGLPRSAAKSVRSARSARAKAPAGADFIFSSSALRTKYGNWAAKIEQAIRALGAVFDCSGLSADDLRAAIHERAAHHVCLIGGYDVIPCFVRDNPTAHVRGDSDLTIPTDAPYGAPPGDLASELAPDKAVSRIPDGTPADPPSFLKTLQFQAQAASTPTPDGCFEEAAEEFGGAAAAVGKVMRHGLRPGPTQTQRVSPPARISDLTLTRELSGCGRINLLLHGADFSPEWAFLFGRAENPADADDYPQALGAWVLDLCDLRGSIVTFGSCYGAMIDTGESEAAGRNESNQVALACLGHGAKAVVAATRSNWIETQEPFDGLGPGLAADFWRELQQGVGAAEALRLAKRKMVLKALQGDEADEPYAFKTLLQMQCYGHPLAML